MLLVWRDVAGRLGGSLFPPPHMGPTPKLIIQKTSFLHTLSCTIRANHSHKSVCVTRWMD